MRLPDAPDDLARLVLQADVRAGARTMRLLEDRDPLGTAVLQRLYPHTGRAYILGITGNPGSGKSTLTDRLIGHYRAAGKRVGVVAVDPSSPYSGGAILGDRIRMQSHATDPGVFIRSMATRGHLGGLARATNDVVHVLDAMGFDVVLVETVGVGQDEVDVVQTAYTSVVIVVPGLGDEIQAIKAGILEIADVFVINKADQPGADRTQVELRQMQSLAQAHPPWLPPIVRAVATRGEGVEETAAAIASHRAWLETEGALAARLRTREMHVLMGIFAEAARERFLATLGHEAGLQATLDRLLRREVDPYSLVREALDRMMRRGSPAASDRPPGDQEPPA